MTIYEFLYKNSITNVNLGFEKNTAIDKVLKYGNDAITTEIFNAISDNVNTYLRGFTLSTNTSIAILGFFITPQKLVYMNILGINASKNNILKSNPMLISSDMHNDLVTDFLLNYIKKLNDKFKFEYFTEMSTQIKSFLESKTKKVVRTYLDPFKLVPNEFKENELIGSYKVRVENKSSLLLFNSTLETSKFDYNAVNNVAEKLVLDILNQSRGLKEIYILPLIDNRISYVYQWAYNIVYKKLCNTDYRLNEREYIIYANLKNVKDKSLRSIWEGSINVNVDIYSQILEERVITILYDNDKSKYLQIYTDTGINDVYLHDISYGVYTQSEALFGGVEKDE